ncbi:MAG: hypothetical protein ABI567_07170 [Gammaproteobacteria bacterium]
MDCRYSRYDALVSINGAKDKARAVVDAMKADVGGLLRAAAAYRVFVTPVTTRVNRETLVSSWCWTGSTSGAMTSWSFAVCRRVGRHLQRRG